MKGHTIADMAFYAIFPHIIVIAVLLWQNKPLQSINWLLEIPLVSGIGLMYGIGLGGES